MIEEDKSETKNGLMEHNRDLRRQGYTQDKRAQAIGRDLRTIQRWDRSDGKTMPGQSSEDFCRRGIHHWVTGILSNRTPFGTAEGRGEPEGYFVNMGKRKTCRFCGVVEETTMVKGEGAITVSSSEWIRKKVSTS